MDEVSQRNLMNGKRIIVVGGGSYRLRNIWQDAAKSGIEVILVEADSQHISRDLVPHFIHYDFSDHKIDDVHAAEIVSLIHGRGLKADGCLSFVDECAPLSALVNEKLGTKGPSFKAMMTANSKTRTQNVLSMRGADISQCPRTDIYSTKPVHLTTEMDCDKLPEGFRFPAVLKLDNGAFAIGACVVENSVELRRKYCEITSTLRNDSDFPGIGLTHGNSMMTMEFYGGTEHIVDVIIYDSKLVAAFITDCGMARRPYFIATARRMPSFLSWDEQTRLIEAAYRCCLKIGLSDGTFNVEFKLTENGPKLLEINSRMGGYCLRDWLRKLYGIDIMLYSLMIAGGISPYVRTPPVDKILIGVMVIPSLHAKILNEEPLRNLLYNMIEKEEIFFLQFRKLSPILPTYDNPFGNIAVSGSTSQEAKQKLMKVCRELDIDQPDYQVEQLIHHF
ncbi:carnosine synthase 1-like [Mercenaria mercenaria]|uniref:carnosine synthase 1-like n=1 Tax=Mercenaria mercenaria TaxID=6596 RepID=UPI00234F3076|nr:carnosine synthase 1-like [Mercenaria mercenaria]XP_053387992.1 carnosine synthase 1-like [Mercenaria mercenaria]XP_053387993.1 carnosine synthase 1-like [Mercenaria mercenaria]